MRSIFIIILSCLLSLYAAATEVNWEPANKEISIGLDVEILEDENGALTFEEVSSAAYSSKFKPSTNEIINFGFTESIHWLKFSLNNNTNKELILEIAHASLPICELYYVTNSGEKIKKEAGYHVPVDNREFASHFQTFSLEKGNKEYFIRLISNTHPLPIRIYEHSEHIIKNYTQQLSYGIYIGMMLFVVITNLFFFFSLRNRIYLFYAIVVAIYSCYALLVLDGFILYLLPKVDMMFWYLTIPTIGITVQTTYCIYFLNTKEFLPKHHKIIKYVIAYFMVCIGLRFVIPMSAVFTVNTTNAMISFFTMGYLGIQVGRNGNRMGYYFASAYLVYFSLVVTEAIYIQTGKPSYLFGLSHVALATVIEALILSFLLSKRTEWEKKKQEKEKELTQQRLLSSIKENEKLVKKQNIILEKEVRKRTENLYTLNKELKEVVATKDKFFTIIAHDLKSPFNALLGLSEILIEDYKNHSEEDKFKYITTLNIGLHRSHNLLENLLIWSNSQRNMISFRPEKLILSDLIKEAILCLHELNKRKNIEIKNLISQSISIKADKNMVLTILRNLITNAIKFTPSNGHIEISITKENKDDSVGFTTIAVKDTGIGIKEENLSKLFTLSSNITSLGTEQEKGSGLGLLICKEFVDRHSGKIWAESEVGKGSSFYFSLPTI